MPGDGTYLGLSEIAKSRLLQWRDIGTIKKYVDAYPKIFKPTILGKGTHDRRYLIAKKNVLRFATLWNAGKLKEFHKLTEARKVQIGKYVSIVYSPFREKDARKLRDHIEKDGYTTSFVRVSSRTKFMHVLTGGETTYRTVIFVLEAENGELAFPEKSVNSTAVRQIASNEGVRGKAVIMSVNGSLKRFVKAFLEKGDVFSYAEVNNPEDTRGVLHALNVSNKKGYTGGRITDLIKEPSYSKYRK
jgi:hypothetical protein